MIHAASGCVVVDPSKMASKSNHLSSRPEHDVLEPSSAPFYLQYSMR